MKSYFFQILIILKVHSTQQKSKNARSCSSPKLRISLTIQMPCNPKNKSMGTEISKIFLLDFFSYGKFRWEWIPNTCKNRPRPPSLNPVHYIFRIYGTPAYLIFYN